MLKAASSAMPPMPYVGANRRIVLSLTTLPSRIHLVRPTLESLLAQALPPDAVYVCVPEFSVRERRGYEIPPFLSPRPFDPRISVLRVEEDYGPGTKIIGPASNAPSDVIIAVDDDHAYADFFIETLVQALQSEPDCAHSFYTYLYHGLMVGQGADGLAVFGRHLQGIEGFFRRVCSYGNARLADDYWISFFLARQGIRMRSAASELRRRGLERVYTQVHAVNALVDAAGLESRGVVMEEAESACFSLGRPTWEMRARRVIGRALAPPQRLVGKVGRRLGRMSRLIGSRVRLGGQR
jgi:hypothetical protein